MERFKELVYQVERMKKLREMEEQLKEQRRFLEHRLGVLRVAVDKEEGDVDTLTRLSLTGLFYAIIGKK